MICLRLIIIIVYIFIIVLNFYATHCFRLYVLEDFSVICFCTFFKRTPMKTILRDGGLLLKEDFFTLNIIIIIII